MPRRRTLSYDSEKEEYVLSQSGELYERELRSGDAVEVYILVKEFSGRGYVIEVEPGGFPDIEDQIEKRA